jgi:hypothetical protein
MEILLKKIFSSKKENKMHIFFLLNNKHIFKNIKILEDPKFHISSNAIYNNQIYLRHNCFTGLRGSLSINTTDWILKSPIKEKILFFLSAFSSRILEIKYEYLYRILNNRNSYINSFLKDLCGFNYNEEIEKIPIKYILNKNKNIYNLIKALEIYLDNKVLVKIEKNFFIKYAREPQLSFNNPINFIFLGRNIYTSNILIILEFNKFSSLIKTYNEKVNLIYLITNFNPNYFIQYKSPKEKLLLKNIVLSKNISFI